MSRFTVALSGLAETDAARFRAVLDKAFGVPRSPGLSEVIIGEAVLTDVVHETGVPNLSIVASGRFPPNPAELLGSHRFRDFIGSLDDHFDWVVIDSPPVLVVTDSSIVAGNNVRNSEITGSWVTIERPRSPCTSRNR